MSKGAHKTHPSHRALLWALLASALLHAALFWRMRAFHPTTVGPRHAEVVELELETVVPPTAPALPAPSQAVRRPRAHAIAHAPTPSVASPPPAAASTPAPMGQEARAPARLNLDLPMANNDAIAIPGTGERAAPSQAQARIQSWFDDDGATERVERGVDVWFAALGKSMEQALKTHPPSPGTPKEVMAQGASEYQAAAATFANQTSGESDPVGPGPAGAAMAHGAMQSPVAAPTLWAVIELTYRRDQLAPLAKVLSSSGNTGFDAHIVEVLAKELPGVPPLGDGGVGIRPEGTRSVWKVAAHLSFERDLSSFDLKKDAWYVPIAAANAALGAFNGGPKIEDYRHPHLDCEVKLLRVY